MGSDKHFADVMKRRELATEIFVRAGTEFDDSDDLTGPRWMVTFLLLASRNYRRCGTVRDSNRGLSTNDRAPKEADRTAMNRTGFVGGPLC